MPGPIDAVPAPADALPVWKACAKFRSEHEVAEHAIAGYLDSLKRLRGRGGREGPHDYILTTLFGVLY